MNRSKHEYEINWIQGDLSKGGFGRKLIESTKTEVLKTAAIVLNEDDVVFLTITKKDVTPTAEETTQV